MNNNYKLILFFLFFLFSSFLFSQVNKEQKPLKNLLIILEEKYDYKFTYADDVIKDIFLEEPSWELELKEILNYFKLKTGLVFQVLRNKFIAIKSPDGLSYICGYIIDNETKTPVESVAIIGSNYQTTSDVFGYFRLQVSTPEERIVIRHLGFQSLSKLGDDFGQDKCLNIYLEPQIEILSEILLTNYITKGISKLIDATYHINFSDFGILPGLIETDVLQTIQALPGVQSANETVSNINIRGGTNDQNLILWDGIKMYQSGHFFGLISIFNPLITTEAMLIKNGTQVNHSDGVSGTITMKTDNNVNNLFRGSIGSNFINIDGFADFPIGKKSSLQIASRKAISDAFETPTYTNYFERILQDTEVRRNTTNSDIKFDFYDVSLRWIYDITNKDQVRINFLVADNRLTFKENVVVNQREESKESNLEQNSISGGIFYRRNWNPKFSTAIQVYETDYELEAINADILEQQRLKQENKVSETSVKLNTWYKRNQLSLLNGYQFTETAVTNLTNVDDPIFTSLVREVIREHAVYSEINYTSSTGETNFQGGFRYNFIDKFNKHIIEPRLSLNQKLVGNFSIEILGELKHQNTSQIINFQNDFLGIEKRRWQLSDNDDIPIIMSKQASFGINYSGGGWLISAEGYFKKVDGITAQSQGFLNQYIFERVDGSYQVNGLDFLINKKIKQLSAWLSYTYADNKYTFKDLAEINFPNNLDIAHFITFGSSFSTEKFKISAGLNWHSGKPTTEPVLGTEIANGQINHQEANSSRLKEYLRIDASATYKFNLTNKIKANVGISIWNGLNNTNIINNYYQVNDNISEKVSNTALSFTPNISFRVSF